MKNLRLNWRSILPFFLLLVLTAYTYVGVFKTFYQQDEWQILGPNVVNGWNIIYANLSPLQILFAEGRILGRLLYFIFLQNPQQGIGPIFVFSQLFHAVNAWLIYLLVKKFKGSSVAAWASGIFFVLNSVSDQAVSWAAAVNTVAATTLILISLYWYVDFLLTKNSYKKTLSFTAAIVSLFFKETGLFLFMFYPLLFAFWYRTTNIKEIFRAHAPILLYGIVVVAFRVIEIRLAPKTLGFVNDQKEGFIFPIAYHSIAYPLTAFFQIFVPAVDVYAFIPKVVRSEYPYLVSSPLFGMVGQSAVTDAFSLLGTIITSGVLEVMMYFDKRKNEMKKMFVFGALLFVLSFAPYAVLHKVFSYMSSRYYYVGAAGAALIFGYVISWLYERLHVVGRIILMTGVVLYFFHHGTVIRDDIRGQASWAAERIQYLAEFKRLHPLMGNKSVLYITSDREYLGGIRYPFQNGLGYILEVLYYNTGKIPKSFIDSNLLWDLGSEGYKESGAFGFGYFQNLSNLGELVRSGNVTPDIVYGYVYNSQTHTMADITSSTRQQLATLSATLK